MTAPRVSVVMATYNHADFVREAMESVLRQRDVAMEFLIADDGSADDTRGVVESIHDERLRFFPHAVNRGACVVTNELIERASGEYIALINSDDRWIGDDKLAYQLRILDGDPSLAASFGRARFIDRAGQPIRKAAIPYGHVFDQSNRSRGAWLRRFFDEGNCLCHPTMLIRRACYTQLGAYDNRLRQLPDFDMWVRLLKHFEIHVCDRELIDFRQLPGENASAVTAVNSRRAINEMYFIFRTFFDAMPRDVLQQGFGDLLVAGGSLDDVHADIEQALLYGRKDSFAACVHEVIGLEKLHALLGSARHRTVLEHEYGIDDRAFQAMAGQIGALGDPAEALESRFTEQLQALERSLSWRVTRPLRWLGRVLRRVRRSA
jgi:glycosyltransferase involved in cell wall biosynthesis